MNRIEILRQYIDNILFNMSDLEERRCKYVHLYGVAQSCALIAFDESNIFRWTCVINI